MNPKKQDPEIVPGTVSLIGAGPGDPGLITLKGRRRIETADVIVYDYLAAPPLLAYARSDAEHIYVGKRGGDHTLSQDGINALIVEKAREGKSVARLKGGDPFIFGRGGEEAEALIAAGIPFEVVPGVTSAIAAAAYAGIPLTHRDYTASVAFVTGHEDPGKAESNIDWKALATGIGTVVFLMGVKNLPDIAARLVAHGCNPETPVALVRWGTTPRQQVVTGTLSTIVEKVRKAGIKAPSVIVVGEVAGLRKTMQWFEPARPLLGKRIVVTRARHQASALLQRLADLGANCLECPMIEIRPPESWDALDAALGRLPEYQWIIFTSVNGVRFFFDRLFALGRDVRALHRLKTACVGPATAEALREYGLTTDVQPASYHGGAAAKAFADQNVAGQRILLPRAAKARPVLPDELRKMGAELDEAAVYQTVQAAVNVDVLKDELASGAVDMVTFTSSSTVRNFHKLFPADKSPEADLNGAAVASIGAITSETARDLGFPIHVEAAEFTIPGLVDAVCRYFAGQSAG
ncbi:MAG: uroporphyrinogen-III C-methyltransferase [Desulfobacterales bacterium]|nr:MAG: uroporphyrinogen-III C-methyltransferase [Desulfobacterales bacterium]